MASSRSRQILGMIVQTENKCNKEEVKRFESKSNEEVST